MLSENTEMSYNFTKLLKKYRKDNAEALHLIKKRKMRWLLSEKKFRDMYCHKKEAKKW